MFKKLSQQKKILKILATFLFALTFLFSFSAATTNTLYLFLLLFALFYWQKKRLQKLLARLPKKISHFFAYLIVAVFWAVIFEITLGQFAFHPRPVISFIISLGFYLPFFVIWYKLISRFRFSLIEVFYLSGLSGILFGLLITKQLWAPFAIYSNIKITLIAFFGRIVATLITYACLTSLPALLLFEKYELVERPFKQSLLALIITILALPFFLIWIVLLKGLSSFSK
ncbi:hypothetical protein ISS86_02090 [Candidatus Microgenomates bacterium]|nr:hypothetical protein [Candidatus Microgenomates bacterium]